MMPGRVVAFVACVAILATAALLLLISVDAHVPFDMVQAALCLVGLGLIADALGHEISRTTNGSTAFIPYLTAAAIAPAWPTVIGLAVSVLLQGVALKRTPIKTAFNVSQATLALAAGILAYRSMGGHDGAFDEIAPFVVLVMVFLVINTATVSAVVSIAERRALIEIWYKSTRSTVLYDLLSLPFVFIFAQLYAQWGAVGVFVLAVPLLGARQLYSTNWRLEKTNQELLQLMVAAIEARDPYTSGHSQRVSRNSKIIARALGMPEKEIERIGRAALLHDVGKIHEAFAPILRKTARLTPEEYALMQTHADKSAELIQNVSYLRDIVDVVRHHHENWDGTGYPAGLAGEAIPLGSRIIMVADTMDAMLTDRPYRAALGREHVTAELQKLQGKQFDPQICSALLASPLYDRLFAASSAVAPQPNAVPPLRLEKATVA